ncbi:MAG TPA: glycosyltransferase family 4 protein [bacterium]|nr:glycosyltransferase family 4 protein [bacterium]HPL95649.1 glycosyltransferase family 4 protein [bacterium]
MKILLINKYFYLKGGAEKHFFALRQLLKDNKNEVIDFAMKDEKNVSSPDENYFISPINTEKLFSWSIFKTMGRILWSLEARKKIKKIIASEKPALVHLHNIYHQISPSILPIFKKYKIPVVMTVHDFALISPSINMFAKNKIYDKIIGRHYYLCLKDRCVKNSFWLSLASVLEMYLHHKILKVYHKNIDLFICPSNFLAEMLIKAGFEKNKIVILPNFIFNKPSVPIEKKQDEKYFLYFGRLSAEKGINVLLAAIKNLPDINLKIAGAGPEEKNCLKIIKEYNLNHVKLLGYQNEINLTKLISHAYAIIVPSLCYENCPLSILESMALGKTVIASNVGGIPELINNDDNGILFKAGDQNALQTVLRELWINEDKCQKMAQNSLNKANKYSAEEYLAKLQNLYKKLCP